MNDGLVGAIIGGLLTGISTWAGMWLQHKKWKTEQAIRILENKRKRLEDLSSDTLNKLSASMADNHYSSEMMSNIDFLFPKGVSDAFEEFMDKGEKTDTEKRHGFYKIAREMKKGILEIDKEIENLIK